MDNEFVYIDDKPFSECYIDKQTMAIINTDKDGIEFKVTGNSKYSIFDIEKSAPEIYAVDSKLRPITAYRTNIINSRLTAISSSTLRSDLYFYKEELATENEKIKHFTNQTKISRIYYFNDSITRVFGNNSFNNCLKFNKNNIKTVKITATKRKSQKIGEINIDNNTISVYLKYDFKYLHNHKNCEQITITNNSHIILKFQKGIIFDEAYKYILLLDSVLYLMTLIKRRHKKLVISDFKNNKYYCRDMKIDNLDNTIRDRNFLICKREESKSNFIKIFELLYILEKESKNALFPFLEFDIKQSSLEIKFLEYYKALEYLDFEKRRKLGKRKNKFFLKDILDNNKDLRDNFFDSQDVNEIEEEIRALRNYYSHEGYYINRLPIPTDNPKRYKNISGEWLYNVLDFIRISSFLEIYKLCDIKIDWKNLIYNIK